MVGADCKESAAGIISQWKKTGELVTAGALGREDLRGEGLWEEANGTNVSARPLVVAAFSV